MIKPRSFSHAAINVTDVERAKSFYEKVLGFTAIERPNFRFGGAWYGIGDNQVHLISREQRAEGLDPLGSSLDKAPPGINPLGPHIAIEVEDYEGTKVALRDQGIEFFEAPTTMAGRQLWVLDPDGNTVELRAQK